MRALHLRKNAHWILPSVSLGLGLLAYGIATSGFAREDRLLPVVASVYPVPGEVGVAAGSRLNIAFNKRMLPKTIGPAAFMLRDDQNRIVPAGVSYQVSTHTAILSPSAALLPGRTYEATVLGGPGGIKDSRGHGLATDRVWRFTTGVASASSPAIGPGGPILLITSAANGFSQYYAEILRNEGFNEFTVADVSQIDSATLQRYDLVLAGEVPLTERQARVLSEWVRAGGNLIAMHPNSRVARIFGQSPASAALEKTPLHDAYLAIQSKTSAGRGLTAKPIQFHGSADRYLMCGGTTLAIFYQNAKMATPFPAVCMQKFGSGNVALFNYDLARSVVYTRQGNPLWSGMERDGISPIRSDDLFYGASVSDPEPDWVDRNQIAIPQADEQQRLLSNIITLMSSAKKPLPHFWYLPRGLKAVIVMTGDDHGHGGTVGRFISYLMKSPIGCSVENWECIRGTSNVFVGSITSSQAERFVNQGFEIGLHVYTGCANWPTQMDREKDGTLSSHVVRSDADSLYSRQLAAFAVAYPGVPAPVSNRIDCIAWGDYDTQPQVELRHGIRFDTNYYFWPPKWVRNEPGLFTGSGMPMRFAKRDGSIIDVYQATTQMTDESQQVYPATVDALLSNALGDSEYYGVFTVNMHNDLPDSAGADAVIAAATSRHVPIVTAAQMLTWLDGRNASSFQNLTWSAGQLGFTIVVGTGGNGIQALLPMTSEAGGLVSLTLDGIEVKCQIRRIAGLNYAAFSAAPGRFVATYHHAGRRGDYRQ
jgi:Bacterial Ig-like domain